MTYHYYDYVSVRNLLFHFSTESKGSLILFYNYDENGRLISVTKNEGGVYATYFYIINLSGDVVGLVDANGQMVASYTYDAYGNLTSTLDPGIESLNPFRY